jgi:hypothetical protein
VGKSVSATDLLRAGRRQESVERPTTKPLDDSATRRLDVETPERSDVQTSERLEAQFPDSPTRQLDAQSQSALAPKRPNAQSYERATVFFTPDQRKWLKETAKSLPVDGLSASDIARLAVNRLRREVESGELVLVEALSEQAYEEAATHPGRRNRGLPPRQQR